MKKFIGFLVILLFFGFTQPDCLAQKETPIFTVVEEMPYYPGGDDACKKFLAENIVYPQAVKEKGIQGNVYVTFVVYENGHLGDIMVLRGIGNGCDEEAVRVVKLMPDWIPGKQNGKNVRVQYNMAVRFSLAPEQKNSKKKDSKTKK